MFVCARCWALVAAVTTVPCAGLKAHGFRELQNLAPARYYGVPLANHVKAAHGQKGEQKSISGFSEEEVARQCSAIFDMLARRDDTTLTAKLWEMACHDRYKCGTTMPLTGGCIYVMKNENLLAMLDTIGRPNPCFFQQMFMNAFFARGTCPGSDASNVTSRGGLTYSTCPGGFLTHEGTCAKAVASSVDPTLKQGKNDISVFTMDSVIGLPEPWEKAVIRRSSASRAQNDEMKEKIEAFEQAVAKAQEVLKTNASALMVEHVFKVEFYACGKLEKAAVLESLCDKQVQVLNQGFAGELRCDRSEMVYRTDNRPSNFKFKPFNAATDLIYIKDERCEVCDDTFPELWIDYMPEEKGKAKVLLCDSSGSILGVSMLPWGTNRGTTINFQTMPGGTQTNYNEGKTLVHELGHYLGLYHTFEGCYPGDLVSDTDPESAPFFGCPSGMKPSQLKSCGGFDFDPVHNFMNYADDRCMCGWTVGQRQRMHEIMLRMSIFGV